ncbi:hypothetical protein P170DRAFT_357607, partial [Aspergillus steynii IBT 23096]
PSDSSSSAAECPCCTSLPIPDLATFAEAIPAENLAPWVLLPWKTSSCIL